MTTPIITVALLERYLRATDPRGHTIRGRNRDGKIHARAAARILSEARDPADAVAEELGAIHVMRLGMCAAAEHLLAHARKIRERDPNEYAAIAVSVIEVDAEQILEMAGVDPSKWEQTRRTEQ